MGRRRNVLGATVVALVLAAAGCGGGGVDEADATATTVEPSTVTEPTSPPTAPTEEQAVLAAYQGYWDTLLMAGNPPDPDHPDLARYATGTALARSRDTLRNQREVGQAVRLPAESRYRHDASIKSQSGEVAILDDCSVDDGLLVGWGTGYVLDDSVVSRQLRATVRKLGEGWRVEDVVVVAEWPGVAGCAA